MTATERPTVVRDTGMRTAFPLAANWHEFDICNAIAGATLAYGWAQITRGLVAPALDPTSRPRDLTPAGATRHNPRPGCGPPASPEATTAALRDRPAAIAARRNTQEAKQ